MQTVAIALFGHINIGASRSLLKKVDHQLHFAVVLKDMIAIIDS